MIDRRCFRVAALALVLVAPRGAMAQSTVAVMGITSEIAPIEQRLHDATQVHAQGLSFRVGTINGRRVVAARTGTGKVNAAIVATVLIGHFNPSALFFSGTAGAVDPALGLGDVVIGATVAHHDVGQHTSDGLKRRGPRSVLTGELDPVLMNAPENLLGAAREAARDLVLPPVKLAGSERSPRIVEGVIVTGEVFVSDVSRRDELRKSLGASAVEMEGAAVAQVCRLFQRSCLVVRSITDRADGQAMASYQIVRGAASENAAALVAAIIGRLRR